MLATSFVEFLAWAQLVALLVLVLLVVVHGPRIARRRFWCALAQRQIEVEFEERGVPGFRRAVAVKRCSVFEPPEAVTCRRRCLDSSFRRQWEPALSICAG